MIFDEEQFAFAQSVAFVLAERGDLDRPARHGVAHVTEEAGRQRKYDGGWLGDGQRRDQRRIGSVYDVAGSIRRTPMRPSLGATIEIRLGGFDRGPIGVDQSGDLIDQARRL
jgi:hypothetical protein